MTAGNSLVCSHIDKRLSSDRSRLSKQMKLLINACILLDMQKMVDINNLAADGYVDNDVSQEDFISELIAVAPRMPFKCFA